MLEILYKTQYSALKNQTVFVLHESIIGLEESELMSQDIMAASAEIF